MTSTSFNVGLTDGNRSSSRVLRPPGGGHTDIFGGEPEPPRGRRPAPAAAANMHAQSGDAMNFSNGDAPAHNGQAAPVTPEQAQPAEAPAPAPEPKQDIPKNIPEPAKADPQKRVRVPPGGFSSGLW